ncbi:MAG: hypothetical protein F9K18_05810 [Thermoanaerobaculia bacterium]|nr:MAG: hypothetical protein F9K18_05810 [Thermoanaerobaculia bacterium]
MRILRLVTTLLSVAVAGLGAVGVVAPAALIDFGRSLLAPPAIWWVAAVRVVFGALLIAAAAGSRMPRTLRGVGAVLVVAGLATPWFGTGRFREAFEAFLSQGPALVRAAALLPLVFGLLLAYLVQPRPRAAS